MKTLPVILFLMWASPALAADDAAVQRGREVYQYWCATCHAAGAHHPGTNALAAKYQGAKPALLEERQDLTAEFVRFMVRNGISVMPFFRKTEISDADLDALTAYLTGSMGSDSIDSR